jgi:hypothetical protein
LKRSIDCDDGSNASVASMHAGGVGTRMPGDEPELGTTDASGEPWTATDGGGLASIAREGDTVGAAPHAATRAGRSIAMRPVVRCITAQTPVVPIRFTRLEKLLLASSSRYA